MRNFSVKCLFLVIAVLGSLSSVSAGRGFDAYGGYISWPGVVGYQTEYTCAAAISDGNAGCQYDWESGQTFCPPDPKVICMATGLEGATCEDHYETEDYALAGPVTCLEVRTRTVTRGSGSNRRTVTETYCAVRGVAGTSPTRVVRGCK